MPNVRIAIFRELLTQLGRGGGGRYLDLATGHGKFAITAQQLGWDVTAVDVRTQRWPEQPGIRWVESDVRTFDIEPGFDCIGLMGLLYHLELDDQLALLRRCAPAPLILDTHIATKATIELGGYPGTIFDEGDLSAPTASWGNPTSFWPTRDSLYRMLYDAGYTSIYERTPFYEKDRTFWLCLSESYPPGRQALVDDFARARTQTPDPADPEPHPEVVATGATAVPPPAPAPAPAPDPDPDPAPPASGLRRGAARVKRLAGRARRRLHRGR